MAISMDSGILLFSDSSLNSVDKSDPLDIIQLSSSLFALYKISCSSSSLKWLLKVRCEKEVIFDQSVYTFIIDLKLYRTGGHFGNL